MPNPEILVLPHAKVRAERPSEVPTLHGVVPLREALAQTWDGKAHFATYNLKTPAPWPRLSKTQSTPELTAGATMPLLALDWDTPGHRDLTDPDVAFLRQVWDLGAPRPTYAYTTPHGARLIYVLKEAVPPLTAEALHRGLVDYLASFGLVCDPQVWDWTRIHKLPCEVKIPWRIEDGPLLDPASVVPKDLCRRTLSLSLDPQPVPDTDHVLSLVFVKQGGKRLTQWAREAKFLLPDSFHALLTPGPPALEPKTRNPTLMSWAGHLCANLASLEGTTAEHIYGLLVLTAQQSQLNDGRDLLAECWKCVQYCWARTDADRIARRQEHLETTTSLLQAIQGWPTPPDMGDDPESWIKRHAIVKAGRGNYYVLQRNGHYKDRAVSRTMVWATLRDSGLGDLVPLYRQTPKGPVHRKIDEILNEHATEIAPETRRGPGPRGQGYLDGEELVFGSYGRRTDLTPAFDRDVDDWLRAMLGKFYEPVCKWIAHALAFERGPICALSLNGYPGIGKGLLTRGLIETTDPASCSTGDVFGTWQYGILDSPWVVVHECWPEVRGLDGAFRALVSGEVMRANTKFNAPVKCLTVPRLIMTANNRSMAEALFSRRGMTLADQRAIAQRLFHVDLDDQGARFLERRGGLDWTRGWVQGAGPSGVQSTYKVAKHFLWFYEQHKDAPVTQRFLMQDMTSDAVIWRLTSASGVTPIVAEALLKCVEGKKGPYEWDPAERVVRVRTSKFLEFYRVHCSFEAGVRFDGVSLGLQLRAFAKPGVSKHWAKGTAWPIDPEKLLTYARDVQLPTPVLNGLCSGDRVGAVGAAGGAA